jgi:hypothetical protein
VVVFFPYNFSYDVFADELVKPCSLFEFTIERQTYFVVNVLVDVYFHRSAQSNRHSVLSFFTKKHTRLC